MKNNGFMNSPNVSLGGLLNYFIPNKDLDLGNFYNFSKPYLKQIVKYKIFLNYKSKLIFIFFISIF